MHLLSDRGHFFHGLEDVLLVRQKPDATDHLHVLVEVEDERNTVRQVELHDVGI